MQTVLSLFVLAAATLSTSANSPTQSSPILPGPLPTRRKVSLPLDTPANMTTRHQGTAAVLLSPRAEGVPDHLQLSADVWLSEPSQRLPLLPQQLDLVHVTSQRQLDSLNQR